MLLVFCCEDLYANTARNGTSTTFCNILCDHIEIIPKVDKDSVWRLLRRLHESCVNRFADIDPMPAKTREETAGRLYGFEMSSFKFEIPYRLISHSIATLVDTPRKLKHVVRNTLRCWQKIHGQVDIDELVVMNSSRLRARGIRCFASQHSSLKAS